MIYLEPLKLKALKARARSEGISQAELMRRLVDQYLDEVRQLPPVSPEAYAKIVALGSTGHEDISDHHDAYLARALQREHAR
jgi:hypothetical protein